MEFATKPLKKRNSKMLRPSNIDAAPKLYLKKRSSENLGLSNINTAPTLKKRKSSEVKRSVKAAAAVASKVQDYVDAGKLKGCNLCVFGPDGIKVSDTFGEHEPDSIYPLYSLTKTFAGLAALQLVEKGLLALDDPVAKYLPSFAFERREGAEGFRVPPRSVTIRHCLTHTAGFTYFFDCVHPHKFMSPHEAAEAPHFMAAVAKNFEKPMSSSEYADEFQAKCALMFEPGTHFNYSESSNVISAVVEKIAGKPFGQYLAEEILGPVGATEVGFECSDYGRMPAFRIAEKYRGELAQFLDDEQHFDLVRSEAASRGDVGLKGTTSDLVRYGQMLLRGGKAEDGTAVLGAKAFELATTNLLGEKTLEPPFGFGAPQLRRVWGPQPGHFGATEQEAEAGRPVNYYPGMGWSGFGGLVVEPEAAGLPESTKGTIWWQGLASTYLAVNPTSGVGVVLMASEGVSGDHQAFFGELIAAAHDEMP